MVKTTIEGDDCNGVSGKSDEVSEAKEEPSDDATLAFKENGMLGLGGWRNKERLEASEEVSDGTQHASESTYEFGEISTEIGSMGKRLGGARKHGHIVKIHEDEDISGGTRDGGRVDEEHRRWVDKMEVTMSVHLDEATHGSVLKKPTDRVEVKEEPDRRERVHLIIHDDEEPTWLMAERSVPRYIARRS